MSKDKRRADLDDKFQQLRSVTNSTSANKASILVKATNHIRELKDKIERLNQELGSTSTYPNTQNQHQQDSFPKVNVETLENMFTVNVESEQNCPGLLLTIIQVFEELGLDVLNAEAACNHGFELAAHGVWNDGVESLDAETVKEVVIQAIRKWMSGTASP
ncbi:unnamed protein product [Amaranthus hypochondriacus]